MSVKLEVILPAEGGEDVPSAQGEYVRLRNTGSQDVDLSGWRVVDANGHEVPLPAGTSIAAGGVLRLHPGPGISDPDRILFGRRAAVINNMREALQLKDATGGIVSALGPGTESFTFNHEVSWPTQLKLIYAGSDPGGFGLPTYTAAIRLSVPDGPQHQLSGSIEGTSVILATLPTGMVPGWYDAELTVRDLTGGERKALRSRLPFGPVDRGTLVLDPPRNPPDWSFAESIRLKITKPVGIRLWELGVTPSVLHPSLQRTDGGPAISGFGPSDVGEETITLRLPREPYAGYQQHFAQHFINPGIPVSIPLKVEALPTFNLVPLPLQAADVKALLNDMFAVSVPASELAPGQVPQWSVTTRSPDEIPGIPGMPASTLSLVKQLVYDSGATVQLRCSLTIEGVRADETGFSGPWLSKTTTESVPMSPRGSSFTAEFGVLRPRIRRHTGAPPEASDGFKARLGIKAILQGLPKPLPNPLQSDVVVGANALMTQLPLLIPSLAVFSDGKYEPGMSGPLPGNRLLVLLDGMPALVGDRVLSTKLNFQEVPPVLTALGTALTVMRTAIPALGRAFSGFPPLPDAPVGESPNTGLDTVIAWLANKSMEVTIAGFNSHPDIGAHEFTGHPAWWDAPSAAFLVGMPAGLLSGRILRAYSEPNAYTEPNGNVPNSAYLDMRVPAGHVAACLWTLHESVFSHGYGPQWPFTTVTEPHPRAQWEDAEAREDRVNMPWFVGKGASFGNVINGYEWLAPPSIPFGFLDNASTSPNRIRVSGWAIDPDTVAPIDVHVYVSGTYAGGATANLPRPDIADAFPGFGQAHGFDFTVPSTAGPRRVCVYAINVTSSLPVPPGLPNPELGCRDVVVPATVVPSVVGLPRAEAEGKVRAAGLHPKLTGSTEPGASVLSQSPPPGSRVPAASTVTLELGTGGGTAVPDVIGLSREEANDEIVAAGLKPSFTGAGWEVGSQSPVGGTTVVVGTTVTLRLFQEPPDR